MIWKGDCSLLSPVFSIPSCGHVIQTLIGIHHPLRGGKISRGERRKSADKQVLLLCVEAPLQKRRLIFLHACQRVPGILFVPPLPQRGYQHWNMLISNRKLMAFRACSLIHRCSRSGHAGAVLLAGELVSVVTLCRAAEAVKPPAPPKPPFNLLLGAVRALPSPAGPCFPALGCLSA